ncbi:HAMP domain-containing sensor histidine kinase [Nosocomiicoccus sp. HMSC059G07]|uniref:sensor histidine kinase n=1 Tax=Nosocomiicoccus sp. HMSC059G07 TaxID=1739531 RepID=UPI0008A5BBB2|nr:HAMP domain-containing sensor histidine kinase [Nosocomiicoccus sp. HMSC059G07]OFO49708.1 two-component sensor histidine kinase [Nosocomiicoccus sp. HMSC059G07]
MKIFPKMFIQIFSVLLVVTLLIHLFVFLIFPKPYLESRKDEIYRKAEEISANLNGESLYYVQESLNFYSENSEIKVTLKGNHNNNAVEINKDVMIDPTSSNNSLIIEERTITLNSGENLDVQFISTADMQKDARDLSFKFLPYSLLLSLIVSVIVALVYAKFIKNNIEEIKSVTDDMMLLDKNASLTVTSNDEIGDLKRQINELYFTLLQSIDDLEVKNKEILKLEALKYDFYRGASHELKTPLASLKIILENMQYNIGKYKDRDKYIANCIEITDELSQNITQILSLSSVDHLKEDEAEILINDVLQNVLDKYRVISKQKNITISNRVEDETIYINHQALTMIMSNLVSNAVKYTDDHGEINIGVDNDWFFIENTYKNVKALNTDGIFDVKFDINKKTSNGLGLYIVSSLLDNYNKQYKVETTDKAFIFKIKINV